MSENEDYYIEKTQKYAENIRNGHKVEHALKRLKEIPMNLKILQQTKIGLVVSKLKDHEDYGRTAEKLVKRWKEDAKAEQAAMERRVQEEEEKGTSSESSASIPEPAPSRKRKSAPTNGTPTLDPFAAMLSLPDKVKPPPKPSKKPKLPTADEITEELTKPSALNYDFLRNKPQNGRSTEKVDIQQFTARKNMSKVFAGRKKDATFKGPILSLHKMCIRVLQMNLETIGIESAIAYLYAKRKLFIPFDVLEPVLEKCTEAQLARIEEKNPHFERDSDKLWRRICHKKFPDTTDPGYDDEWDGSWKQCVKYLTEQRDEKLELATKKIKKHVEETTIPQRKAMFSDAIAPRNVRRRQQKNGISGPAISLPTAVEISKSRRQIFESGSKTELKSLPPSIRNSTSTSGSHSSRSSGSTKTPVSKKGSLMVKALRMMKGSRR